MKTFTINRVTKTLHEWHMELWNWLADNPDKYKNDWFEFMESNNLPHLYCFACEIDFVMGENCDYCPILNEIGCFDDGLYSKWYHETNLQQRSEYARQIANLEWNEQEETDVQ